MYDLGLTTEEAARKLELRGPMAPPGTSRSYGSILRANIFTVFNLILAFFGALTLTFGSWEDALFLGILVTNTLIGIIQETRAKLALDRLFGLVAPTTTVIRDGQPRKLPREEVVEGDLIAIEPGDQLVADGILQSSEGLQLDESILTGESRTVRHEKGDEIRSGSFVSEGTGRYTVTATGAESYAARITGEARRFRHPRSPLELVMNRLLYILVGAMVPLSLALGYVLWHRHASISSAVATSVAAIVPLVPEGLILLVNVTFAVSAVRMASRGALAQQINAMESLASVDVVCLDKTGTLTEADLVVKEVIPAKNRGEQLKSALAKFAASASARNSTLRAIATAFPGPPENSEQEVPFSSRWRWSGLQLGGVSYVLGAPELFPLGPLESAAQREAASGRRVVAFASRSLPFEDEDQSRKIPENLELLGLIVLAERLRSNARETVEFFKSQGVQLKVLSGDRPETALAIAGDSGIPVEGGAADGDALPEDDKSLIDLISTKNVVGRISPEGKKRVIQALSEDGHYVAMIGDGVNDVPGLKAAKLAIAQGTGVQMARSVADLVLVSGDFGAVPLLVGEGRTTLRNLQRVTKLFVTKSAVTAFMILAYIVSATAYPLLPRQMTIVASLGVGIPAFFVALAPSKGRVSFEGFLKEAARFSIPAGFSLGVGVTASFLAALWIYDFPLVKGRTIATTVMLLVMLYLIVVIEASSLLRGAAVLLLCLALFGVYVVILYTPIGRSFFELANPDLSLALIVAGGTISAIAIRTLIAMALSSSKRHRPLGDEGYRH